MTPEPGEKTKVLTWQLETMLPATKKEITLVLVPEGSGEVSCSAARVQFEHGECVSTRLTPSTRPLPTTPPAPAPPSAPALQVRKEGPKQAALYDYLNYKLVVTNAGRAAAKNVILEDTLPEGLEFMNSNPSTPGDKNPLVWNLGDLQAGASWYDRVSGRGEENRHALK